MASLTLDREQQGATEKESQPSDKLSKILYEPDILIPEMIPHETTHTAREASQACRTPLHATTSRAQRLIVLLPSAAAGLAKRTEFWVVTFAYVTYTCGFVRDEACELLRLSRWLSASLQKRVGSLVGGSVMSVIFECGYPRRWGLR